MIKIKKILIVDDSSFLRKAIASFLNNSGYDSEFAAGGFEALSKIEKSDYGLVILDYEMPDMSGFEVLTLLKSSDHLKQVPVIILSGDKKAETIKSLIEAGANGHIIKSNDLNPLLHKIKQLMP